MRAATPIGSNRDRAAARTWLAPRYPTLGDERRIIITNGTQSALLLFLRIYAPIGSVILAEQLSYGVLPNLARTAGVTVRGVPLDGEGMIPDEFERLCREASPVALYCNPTFHNPTTSTLSAERRAAIAAIARTYGVKIFEDDPLGLLHPDAAPPIASLAPEVSWYTMGMTKCMAQGIRVGFCVIPKGIDLSMQLGEVGRLSHWLASPLAVALVTEMIESGLAHTILGEIRDECQRRQELACDLLNNFAISCPPRSMHLWLRLPTGTSEEQIISTLASQGISVRGSAQFVADGGGAGANALRLSLSSPGSIELLARGLKQILSTLISANRAR
ncbi:aminotransferase class I/II-fold pyridoxal phosphate-dependent enzyme [Bradyrhizobium valentinum]|uniref:aminotransferase class I/II-fold pyridoxal phosphate-dependent enzyme n=1 Tax=Bradyrhizobium valentinum TaxID=1518501 RepID=UPI0018D25807|nr:PLP-dependent aminotransferase family protein [Bradyrhizobium valentinum]